MLQQQGLPQLREQTHHCTARVAHTEWSHSYTKQMRTRSSSDVNNMGPPLLCPNQNNKFRESPYWQQPCVRSWSANLRSLSKESAIVHAASVQSYASHWLCEVTLKKSRWLALHPCHDAVICTASLVMWGHANRQHVHGVWESETARLD